MIRKNLQNILEFTQEKNPTIVRFVANDLLFLDV